MNASGIPNGPARCALALALLSIPAFAQTTTRVSVDTSGVAGNGDSGYPSDQPISADGNVVAFTSVATNLVAGDTNGCADAFVHDRTTGVTERVSVDSAGAEGNQKSGAGMSLSSDGQIVAFMSYATNLVAGDTNGAPDVFVRDRSTGRTERVSVASSGAEANADSYSPSLSADGQIVAFMSYASNLVAGDTNGALDVFVHDRSTGRTERVSVASSGAEGNANSTSPSLSADGRIVAFDSYASNLLGLTRPGREWSSTAGGLMITPTPSGREFLGHGFYAGFDNETVSLDLANLPTHTGIEVSFDLFVIEGWDGNAGPSVWEFSADGRILLKTTFSNSLFVYQAFPDFFPGGSHPEFTGSSERGTLGYWTSSVYHLTFAIPHADSDVTLSFAAAGLYVGAASWGLDNVSVELSGTDHERKVGGVRSRSNVFYFNSFSRAAKTDTNDDYDVFVHDRSTGLTERVSVDSSGAQSNDGCFGSSLSADGNVVVFTSRATNLVAGSDANQEMDVFLRDRSTGVTERVSVNSWGVGGSDRSWLGSPSADGSVVAFASRAENLVATDSNRWWDVFVHDRATGVTERVSVDSSGLQGNKYVNYFGFNGISADGRVVSFGSFADNLVPGDSNRAVDVFVRER